ncbi:dihydroneopterin aldolase [Francisella tularensis]|uniref:Dihydroneopterin aldolase n=3 Tax=Francisella tularensis TaxID=263 RepID=Q5NGA6_FRATT|nr:dihydroneopterin aldolase [Francisella tularensis]ABO46702.1 putative dihydroneopterin aldolase [Francisella tularensis subsp. tularensis WY96-3418]ADA78624.1 putative dihydroneopterin aldolase [Francisella tularensis subsp. tularensis NE061598]AFB79035.1 Dihydroneopterin aldolase [Francisella tularensis subsp. tularensis TIGB03]AFB80580.1 Dihydroneopterin aldolase [Francisella tularensis subsp. tularensis TI0902]AJI62398.1 FolB domain protein [Francisella tularensis subsp. tularensis]
MKQSLFLNDVKIYVSLGCSGEERAYKQMITLDLELEFSQNYRASDSDNLEETICYYTLRNNIQQFCDSISCNLIEYLAKQIYLFIQKNYSDITIKYLKINKKPPVSQIESACFIIRN